MNIFQEYVCLFSDGSFAIVDKHRTVIHRPSGTTDVVANEGDHDLYFAMRGAGSSFAIITEFLYRVS